MEIWKTSSLDAAYEVSSMGRVKAKERKVLHVSSSRSGEYYRSFPERLIKPFVVSSTGYYQVNLTRHKRVSVHRMVAIEHCAGYESGLVVNHKNGDKADNRAENLEWVTHSENLIHGYRVLGAKCSSFGKFGEDHAKSKAVISKRISSGEEKRYESGMDAVREGFTSSQISRCCNGKIKSHKGYIWRFAEPALEAYEQYRKP